MTPKENAEANAAILTNEQDKTGITSYSIRKGTYITHDSGVNNILNGLHGSPLISFYAVAYELGFEVVLRKRN